MINLREAERKQQLQNKEMKMKVLEQDTLIHELESALEQLQLQCDRRLTLLQKEHEQKVQLLLNHFKGKSLGVGWVRGVLREGARPRVISFTCVATVFFVIWCKMTHARSVVLFVCSRH